MSAQKFAVVTGASTGIGLELAKCCAEDGFDLVIAANEPAVEAAAADLRRRGGSVQAVGPISPRRKASTSSMRQSATGRSTHCWRMPASVSAMRFSIRISGGSGAWSIPISPARSISSIAPATRCSGAIRGASSSQGQLPASCPAASRPSIMAPRRFSIPSPSRCARSCATAESPSLV